MKLGHKRAGLSCLDILHIIKILVYLECTMHILGGYAVGGTVFDQELDCVRVMLSIEAHNARPSDLVEPRPNPRLRKKAWIRVSGER